MFGVESGLAVNSAEIGAEAVVDFGGNVLETGANLVGRGLQGIRNLFR